MSETWIERRFGTPRGAVRLALSYGEVALGLAAIRPALTGEVLRLVFVCHGNICRSAYAEALARRAGLNTASFGLSTTTGAPAHAPLAEIARARGISLDDHHATAVDDYEPLPGDFLLAMECRHLRKLGRQARFTHLPRNLLGSYARPRMPHLHDPYMLGPGYTDICLARIETALAQLAISYPAARAG